MSAAHRTRRCLRVQAARSARRAILIAFADARLFAGMSTPRGYWAARLGLDASAARHVTIRMRRPVVRSA